MGKSRFFSMATAAVVVLNLGVVTTSSVDAAQRNNTGSCVAVSGGTVSNATDLAIDANGGTSISDASGGTGNLAFSPGNDNTTNGNNNGNNNNGNNNNNNNNNVTTTITMPIPRAGT